MTQRKLETVRLTKLIQGGQALGELESGKKIFVWGGLPDETVEVRITKNRSSYAEGIVENVLVPSKLRIPVKEPNSYMSTSPWQIMDYGYETQVKKELVIDASNQHNVILPEFEVANSINESSSYGYRNKMEYSFYGDEQGIHLALFKRGTHYKNIVDGCDLADPFIDSSATAVLDLLKAEDIRASDLKSLIVRTSSSGDIVGCLFVKAKKFPKINVPEIFTGFSVYFSNPKSPASVATEELQRDGSDSLTETINGKTIKYGALGFFQVNIPVFEQAVKRISDYTANQPVIDMYGGVGTISVAIGASRTTIVESDQANIEYAKINTNEMNAKIIHAPGEKSLKYIEQDSILIVDPPRAGLHKNVAEAVVEVQPKAVVYLSCNPVTMMRDLSVLETYKIVDFAVYNFFPRTPHIECLAVLELK
ncbi:MAG: TRAM domain-containing protein [Patescibacteria group bacterium]